MFVIIQASIRSSEVAGISHRLDSLLKSISKSNESPKHDMNKDGGVFQSESKRGFVRNHQSHNDRSPKMDTDLRKQSGILASKNSGAYVSGVWSKKDNHDGSGSSGSDSWLNGLKGGSGGKKSPKTNAIDNVLFSNVD